jgi:hypothetical protein
MDRLSVQTVARDGICLFRSFSTLLEYEGQQNKLRQKRYISESTVSISYRFRYQRALVSSVK